MPKSDPKKLELELHPDAWKRFERAMAVVVKAPPQHRIAKKAKASRRKSPGGKGRKSQAKKPGKK